MANMFQLIGGVVSAIALAIGLMVFGTILPALNNDAIGSSAVTLINQVPIILAGVFLLGIVVMSFGALGR